MFVFDKNIKSISFSDFKDGMVVLIDKEKNWTSFDVVAKIRNTLRKFFPDRIKVGHAGTLDPLATGLVVVFTGQYTKLINNFLDEDKSYTAMVKFGAVTPSFDLETEEQNFSDTSFLNFELINRTLDEKFKGEILQTPPSYSAKRINGERAYEKVRKGEQPELKPVKVTIKNIELSSFESPYAEINVSCTKGTYIRSLANDLGKELGCGAYLKDLRRTGSGEFNVENALNVKDFCKLININKI